MSALSSVKYFGFTKHLSSRVFMYTSRRSRSSISIAETVFCFILRIFASSD